MDKKRTLEAVVKLPSREKGPLRGSPRSGLPLTAERNLQ